MTEVRDGYEIIELCRLCRGPDLELVLEFGNMPLSDALVRSGSDRADERLYPLTLVRCRGCSLIQIRETIDPNLLYGQEYPYYSSFSDFLLRHSRTHVEKLMRERHLDGDSLVVEVASNDGYLLQFFAEQGVPVLGIDPAAGPASEAAAKGIPTIQAFFNLELAETLASEGRRADLIIGNNVLAHVPDQNELVAAIEVLLAPGGRVTMEVPYVKDLIDHSEFDTIYHEHHCYFSASTVSRLFHRHGLDLVSVEHLDIHGGSLRVSFERGGHADASGEAFLDLEAACGLQDAGYYADFASRARRVRENLTDLLGQLKSAGFRIAAYGAAAKGAILLNYCGIDEWVLNYVVDRNIHKHGWEMPGVRLPICDTDRLKIDTPDYLLVLAWNLKDEIMAQQSWFAEQGGRFILPVPTPTVV